MSQPTEPEKLALESPLGALWAAHQEALQAEQALVEGIRETTDDLTTLRVWLANADSDSATPEQFAHETAREVLLSRTLARNEQELASMQPTTQRLRAAWSTAWGNYLRCAEIGRQAADSPFYAKEGPRALEVVHRLTSPDGREQALPEERVRWAQLTDHACRREQHPSRVPSVA